ncbi:hypothetical protein RHMOL_Rhmol01G0179000 [Rhododendron molle]|uniref:Uncharacterized protein n=1 Tax=Rhododendron molle TaxID=49168 RepID=A0ACC0Q422_RHOML|nr:hypothetical protein RHMOL_Rhmol01G0179000 [Rhododendron molle]
MPPKAGVFYDKVSNVTIWGNHSTTQVPDFLNARINSLPVKEVINNVNWSEEEFSRREVKCLSRSAEDPQVHQLLSQLPMPSDLLSLQLLRRLVYFWSKSFLLTFWLE